MAIMFVCGGGDGFRFGLFKFFTFTASPIQETNVAYSLNASKDIYIRVHAPHIFFSLKSKIFWDFSVHTLKNCCSY